MSKPLYPPYPIWREPRGTFTVCKACHRLVEGLPPIMCEDCLAVERTKRRERRAARKLKAVT